MQPGTQLSPPNIPPAPPLAMPRHRKSLVIALVASAILLMAAAGVALWAWLTPHSAKIVGNTGNASQGMADANTQSVTKASFVPPSTIPAQYVKRDQTTSDTATIYYFDNATSCGITATVLKLGGPLGATPKEAIVNSAKSAESLGVKTTRSVDAPSIKLKDVTSSVRYTFASLALEQDVSVQGVSFTHQSNMTAFKQFGPLVASIGYSCKAETWQAKKAELQNIVTSFTIKTER